MSPESKPESKGRGTFYGFRLIGEEGILTLWRTHAQAKAFLDTYVDKDEFEIVRVEVTPV